MWLSLQKVKTSACNKRLINWWKTCEGWYYYQRRRTSRDAKSRVVICQLRIPKACRCKSIIILIAIFLYGRATSFFIANNNHYMTSIYSLQLVTRRITEISSLIVFKNISTGISKQRKPDQESRVTRETPSTRKYQSHSIKIQNEPDKMEISRKYYLTTRENSKSTFPRRNLSVDYRAN